MTAHELAREVESGLMAEQRVPNLLPADNVNISSTAPTLNNDDHHLEKSTTHSSHAQTEIAGEKGEKDVDGAIPDEDSGLLSGARLYLVFMSLMLAVLVSSSVWYCILTSDVRVGSVNCRDRHPSPCLRFQRICSSPMGHHWVRALLLICFTMLII